MQLNTASCSATSITWPGPPFTLWWCSAISTPITPCSAASVSPIDTPTRTGTRPGSAAQVAQAAHGLADDAESRPVAIGAGLPVAADAQHHRPRVALREHVPAQAPAFERAGAEFSTSTSASSTRLRTMSWASGVRRSSATRALVARLHLPPHGGAVLHQAPLAQRVAGAGRLHLDDLGAELAQHPGAEGPGDELAELDDLQARERADSGTHARTSEGSASNRSKPQ